MKTKFYSLTQNNSGGSFIVDDILCHRLIIEATNEEEALCKAEQLGCYWNGVEEGYDCKCCGDRWYPYADDIILKNGMTIEDYAQREVEQWNSTTPDIRIFFLDGTVKEFPKKA
jgi:hypothetical protein